jgi:hypothetical protein
MLPPVFSWNVHRSEYGRRHEPASVLKDKERKEGMSFVDPSRKSGEQVSNLRTRVSVPVQSPCPCRHAAAKLWLTPWDWRPGTF